jgi:membrane-bound lytic murein transglycosylase D
LPQVAPLPEAKPAPADAVTDVIDKVEKEYQTAQAHLHAGDAEAARKSFDNAFNLLLSADVHGDDRLEKEFEKLLAGANELEQSAQSDAGPAQKAEPAPIDEANSVNFPVDPNIKAKAAVEMKSTHSDLPLVLNDTVAGYINYFSTRGRGVLERALARSGQYQDMIHRTLREEGVPQDLIYLAEAESGFHPLALSHAGARGMWQFMASRAHGYGLQRNQWVDDRQDPEKATRAAARHLKDLYNQFGDWYLAMAAYNSGPGTVQSAVKRTGYADFWELYQRNVLPRETRNYVPIILAVTIMAKNPIQYGLDDVELEKPVATDVVKIDYPVDLRLVADCLDVSTADLQELNPSLLRLTTPRDQTFDLHLPAGTKEKYLNAIAAIPPSMRLWWRYHTVHQNETLTAVARRYRTTPKAIAEVNGLSASALEPDSKLIIPVSAKSSSNSDGQAYSKRAIPYKVRKNDTVATVADTFGVPPQMVRRWNRLKSDSLRGRRVIYVHLPVTANASETHVAAAVPKKRVAKTAAPSQVVRHRVKPGETLSSIANSYKTTISAIKRDNGELATLRPGMILIIRGLR